MDDIYIDLKKQDTKITANFIQHSLYLISTVVAYSTSYCQLWTVNDIYFPLFDLFRFMPEIFFQT